MVASDGYHYPKSKLFVKQAYRYEKTRIGVVLLQKLRKLSPSRMFRQ